MKKIVLISIVLSSFVTNINASAQQYLRQRFSLSSIGSGLSSLAHAAKHSWKTSSITEKLGIGAAAITTGIFIGHAFSDWRKRKAAAKDQGPNTKHQTPKNNLETNIQIWQQNIQNFNTTHIGNEQQHNINSQNLKKEIEDLNEKTQNLEEKIQNHDENIQDLKHDIQAFKDDLTRSAAE